MFGLALDSAGPLASAAVWRDRSDDPEDRGPDKAGQPSAAVLLGYQTLSADIGKADQLILVVEQLIEAAGLRYQDLGIIAVNRGPGSFTGIRSAVALARGLALAIGCPTIGVTSHEAIAAGINRDGDLVSADRSLMVALDARRGQLYHQSFGPGLTSLSQPSAEVPENVARWLKSGRWCLAGSGAMLVHDSLQGSSDITVIDDAPLNAEGVVIAAHKRLGEGETPTPGFELRPLYIRAPDAIKPKPLVSAISKPVEV